MARKCNNDLRAILGGLRGGASLLGGLWIGASLLACSDRFSGSKPTPDGGACTQTACPAESDEDTGGSPGPSPLGDAPDNGTAVNANESPSEGALGGVLRGSAPGSSFAPAAAAADAGPAIASGSSSTTANSPGVSNEGSGDTTAGAPSPPGAGASPESPGEPGSEPTLPDGAGSAVESPAPVPAGPPTEPIAEPEEPAGAPSSAPPAPAEQPPPDPLQDEPVGGCDNQLLANGTFDQGNTGWETSSSWPGAEAIVAWDNTGLVAAAVTPYAGGYLAWLGGIPDNEWDSHIVNLQQTVTIPEEAARLTFSGKIWVRTEESDPGIAFDELYVDLLTEDEKPVWLANVWTNLDASDGWGDFSFDTTTEAITGRRLILLLHSETDPENQTSFWLDSLRLVASCGR